MVSAILASLRPLLERLAKANPAAIDLRSLPMSPQGPRPNFSGCSARAKFRRRSMQKEYSTLRETERFRESGG